MFGKVRGFPSGYALFGKVSGLVYRTERAKCSEYVKRVPFYNFIKNGSPTYEFLTSVSSLMSIQ